MEPGKGAACCWGSGLLSPETLPLFASVSPSVRATPDADQYSTPRRGGMTTGAGVRDESKG